MRDTGYCLESGLTLRKSAHFSPPDATSYPAARVTREDTEMKALVCYPSHPIFCELVSALEKHDCFGQIIQCDSVDRLQQASRTHPDAFVFTDLPAIRLSQDCIVNRQDWIVLGENNHDALEAFTTHAMSFLRIPIDSAQLNACLGRLQQLHASRLRQRQFTALKTGLCQQFGVGEAALAAMLRRQHSEQAKPDVVGVRSGNSWCCVSASEVRWIEAAGDYMCVHTHSEQYIVRSTLGALTKRFAEVDFMPCNRSTVVNVAYIRALVWLRPAILVAELNDGKQLKISRRCFAAYWQQHPLAAPSPEQSGELRP